MNRCVSPWLSNLRHLTSVSSIQGSKSDKTIDKAVDRLCAIGGGEVRLAIHGDRATVTLHNPARKNALSGKMMVQLREVVAELESASERLRTVVLQGSDGVFCSGGDLEFVRQICNANDGFLMCSLMRSTLGRLAALPVVSLSKIEGFALGGGTELALACDIRAIHSEAKVGFVQGRMGVSPGWGGAEAIVKTLGAARAIELLACSSVIGADRAVELGVAQHLFKDSNDFEDYLKKFNNTDIVSVKAAKRVVHAWRSTDRADDAFEKEREVFTSLWGGPAQKKALDSALKHK